MCELTYREILSALFQQGEGTVEFFSRGTPEFYPGRVLFMDEVCRVRRDVPKEALTCRGQLKLKPQGKSYVDDYGLNI